MSKLDNKEKAKQSTQKKTVKKETTKVGPVKAVKKIEEQSTDGSVQSKITKEKTRNEDETKAKEDELSKKIKEAKESAVGSISNILDNIEMTFFRLKTEESKSIDLANSTGIELNIDRINDDSINSNINSIKESSFVVKKKIQMSMITSF